MKIKKAVKFKDTEFYFNDCYICQEVAIADEEDRSLSVDELKGIFDKAKQSISFSEKSKSS